MSGWEAPRPLEGIKVLEVAQLVSGPLCGTILAGLGASVTKVEPPGGDMARQFGPFVEGKSAYFEAVNRGKTSLRLDLRSDQGRAEMQRLLSTADVLISNMSQRAASAAGLGIEELRSAYPRVVLCPITAFGDGPEAAGLVGVDLVFQAESGLMHVTGERADVPVRAGTNVPDFVASMSAVAGILAALRERDRMGRAPVVSLSLLAAAVALQTCWVAARSAGAEVAGLGNGSPFSAPTGAFRAADRHVVLSVVNDAQWARFCTLVAPELAGDSRFTTNERRCQHRSELGQRVASAVRRRAAQDWVDELQQAGIPAGLVRSYDEVMARWPGLFDEEDGWAVAKGAFELRHAPGGGTVP